MDPWKYGPYQPDNYTCKNVKGPGYAVRKSDSGQQDQERQDITHQKRHSENQQSLPDDHSSKEHGRLEKMHAPPGIKGNKPYDRNQQGTDRQITRPPPGFERKFNDRDRMYGNDTPKVHGHGGYENNQVFLKEYLNYSHESSKDQRTSVPSNTNEAYGIQTWTDDKISSPNKPSFSNDMSCQQTNGQPCKPPPGFNLDGESQTILSNDEFVDKHTNNSYRNDAKFEADTEKAITISKQDQSKNTFSETDVNLAIAISKQNTESKEGSPDLMFAKIDSYEQPKSYNKGHKKRDKQYYEDIERAKKESLETLSSENQNMNDTKSTEFIKQEGTSSNKEQFSDDIFNSDKSSKEAFSDMERQQALEKAKGWNTHDNIDYDDASSYYDYRNEKEYQAATEKYVYFWRNHDIYSQWHKSKFVVNEKKFNCAEQYMMYKKAELFEDWRIAKKILGEKDPRKIKALGRQVQGFSEEMWAHNCLYIVKEASIEKFSQNDDMKQELYSTYPKILVEASPYDKIWGIGFSEEDYEAWDETKWRGKNWLGFILTEARDEMMEKDGIIESRHKKLFLGDLLKTELRKYENSSDGPIKEQWKPFSDTPKQGKSRKNKNTKENKVKDRGNCNKKESMSCKVETEGCQDENTSSNKMGPVSETFKEQSATHEQELETGQMVEDTTHGDLDKPNGDTLDRDHHQSSAGHIPHDRDKANQEGSVDISTENTQAGKGKNQNKSSTEDIDTSLQMIEFEDNSTALKTEVQDISLEDVEMVYAEDVKDANTSKVGKSGDVCDTKPQPRSCWTESTLGIKGVDMEEPMDSVAASFEKVNSENCVEGTASKNNEWELV